MGYNSARSTAAATTTDTSWKADAFLNLWVSRKDGTKMKVGAIPLKMARAAEAALIERLKQEGAIESFAKALQVDFQLAESTKVRADFDF